MVVRPKVWGGLFVALCVLALGLLCIGGLPGATGTRKPPVPHQDTAARAAEGSGIAPKSVGQPPGATRVEDPAPRAGVLVQEASLIERVEFEPAQPCAGDTVLVHTHLHAANRGAKVFVDGKPGSPQVLVAGGPGRQEVRVMARSWGDRYELRRVPLEVLACAEREGRWVLRASARRVGERTYLFALPGFRGTVHWDFGDGTGEDTSEGEPLVHRYGVRTERPQSTYLAVAHYRGPDGPARAPVAVTHVEPEAIAQRTAFPVLYNEGQRFVNWDGETGLATRRRITNSLSEDLDFSVAQVRAFPCDGSAAVERQLPAAEVLNETFLPAGATRDLAMHVNASEFDLPVCQMLVRLGGLAGDRLTTTTMAFDTGVPDERWPVEDQETLAALAALAAARGQTGQPITAEELEIYRAMSAARGD